MTKHIRIRSISFRSIRGLYLRQGKHTLRADRISWWGFSRLTLKVDNLSIDIGEEPKEKPVSTNGSPRKLSLTVLNPSPVIRQFRRLFGVLVSYLDPVLRPIIRQNVVALLRIAIRWLPRITQRMTFELKNTTVTFAALPGTKITTEEVMFVASVDLIELEPSPEALLDAMAAENKKNSVMTAWTNRMTEGFKRSLDRAWGSTKGKGKVEFKVYNIQGYMPLNVGGPASSFLSLPDPIDLVASMDFNPRAGSIETNTLEFGLTLGDCSAKVDLVMLLLEKLKPKASPTPPRPPPHNITVDSPPSRYSSFGFPSGGISASIQSALPSFASSLFSPGSISRPMSAFSPTAGNLLSPKSPASPFFRAISASMRPRRKTLIQPTFRLKDTVKVSTLAVLRKVEVKISSITLSASRKSPLGPYRGVLKHLRVSSELAHLSESSHKQRWLGLSRTPEIYDADSYMFIVSLKKMRLERGTRLDSLPLVKIGEQSIHVLAHQWPAPLLVVTPFMSGDPNAPFVGAAFKIAKVEATQRLDHFQELLNSVTLVLQSSSEPARQKPLVPPVLTLPRLSLAAEVGPVCTKLIFASTSSGQDLRALELRTDGCMVTAHSDYHHATPTILAQYPTSSSVVPVQLQAGLSLFLEPITVMTRSAMDERGADVSEDPSVFSMGSFELTGRFHGIAETDGPGEGVAVLERQSIACECSSVIDSICIELWNPNVIDSVHQLLSVIPVKKVAPPTDKPIGSKTSRFSKLPFGLTARGSLGQFVVFVTAPDINPNDTLDLSRGISIRFASVLECRALLPSHMHWFEHKQKSESRTGLRLSYDTLHAEKSRLPGLHDSSIFVRLQLLHTVLRSMVATPFEPSEPLIAERVDAPQLPQDVFRIKQIQVDLRITSPPSLPFDDVQQEDVLEAKIAIPSIRGDFKIAHIYSTLLAIQTVKSLQPPRSAPAPGVAVRSRFTFTLQLDIPTIQFFWTLPKRNIVTRIDNFAISLSSTGPPTIGFDHAAIFVPLPGRVNRWEGDVPGRWAELLRLQQWRLLVSPLGDSVSIAIQGKAAQLKVPSGFVFFDLVFDTILVVKALKHITHITKAGRFWRMPFPEPEGPKSIPLVNVQLDFLCLELQDDPFEAKLGLIWQAGFEAARQRKEREEAFTAKVAAILLAEQQAGTISVDSSYQFSPQHTVSIDEARQRLDKVHVLDWKMRLDKLKKTRQGENDAIFSDLFGSEPLPYASREANIVPVVQSSGQDPPLLRFALHNLNMSLSQPSFPLNDLPTWLHKQGSGLPQETRFSLLVPLHLHFSLSGIRATLRDYPIPLIDILPHDDGKTTVWTFDTDLAIAEEMGTEDSVLWFECDVIDQQDALHGEALWSLMIPKTIMPVKTYANASINVDSPYPTILAWGVSYGPTIQDVMRIVETLTSPPQDPSPVMGFWDKLRLVMHWTMDIKFAADVHVYMKGARDPYETHDEGAGFVLGFQGNPRLRIGFENEQKELVQLTSDIMVIAVPDLDYVSPTGFASHDARTMGIPKPFKKVWARLNSGIRFGVGFLPERSCGPECTTCSGTPFQRHCRLFEFKKHYEVKMTTKPFIPEAKSVDDSYNGFRSDFVHLSFSLESSLKKVANRSSIQRDYSSLHLTAMLFANFWAWCSLFNGAMSLPIRQGKYYPPRPISPKLGKHIATLKYRISIPHLYVMHGYIDDSRETWVDGVTSWVGVKGMVDEFHVDMHQREEETTVPGPIPGTTRVLRHKPFYAAEVVLKGLDLRALVATFPDVLKKDVPIAAPPQRSNYRKHENLPTTSPTSPWHDPNDFVELGWRSSARPVLNLLPVATIPRFAYFKRISSTHNRGLTNKFGSEHSHICLLDQEPSVPKVQILLASARAAELRSLIRKATQRSLGRVPFDQRTAEKMVALLEDYVTVLQNFDSGKGDNATDSQTYFLPSEMTSSAEVAEFENVYQIHCPSIFLESAIRDIILQYYYCSRARRGVEYHMATRAVKFIRDQANASGFDLDTTSDKTRPDSMADLASATLRKILKTDSPKPSFELRRDKPDLIKGKVDPLDGWAEGVTLNKSHVCLLLKPQVVMRGADAKDTIIVTAGQAKLQIFSIMDDLHIDDPISGKVMARNYMSLSGLQVYAPLHPLALGNSSIPLEVLIDLRCESAQFERLVPQTDATFHYDKFNRLRLRNTVTTAAARVCADDSQADSHLRNQTDLIRVHIPRFTVAANAQHFQAISNVVTKLLLFSDAVHKTRLDRLETLIFAFDFRDLNSAANVICNLQDRLRDATLTRKLSSRDPKRTADTVDKLSFLKINAHIFLLEEELSLLFDAIKLAQDRFAASAEQNSALLLHASSSEISWKMLDDRTNLLSKLVVQNIDFNWLNRQDSSTVNHLSVGNLTAFDGSRTAMWAEIISKYDEPSNHPLLKKGLFCLANWTILAPVGGITIYETFELSFHPLRLQIDAKVGKKIMEYVWPDRKDRETDNPSVEVKSPVRASVDSPRGLHGPKPPEPTLAAPRRLAASRSFTDLRATTESFLAAPSFLTRNRSSESLNPEREKKTVDNPSQDLTTEFAEATVMKNRSSQKSFVFVRISSLNLLLSISKEGSFECRDARIKTKDLEYRNQTWSFEELVNQFIPSNMSWRGWVKMAFHQPLLPVLPVAKELISKTRWTSSKGAPVHDSPLKLLHPRMLVADDDSRLEWLQREGTKLEVRPNNGSRSSKKSPMKEVNFSTPAPAAPPPPITTITSQPLSAEPESMMDAPIGAPQKRAANRNRVKSLFTRHKSKGSSSVDDLGS